MKRLGGGFGLRPFLVQPEQAGEDFVLCTVDPFRHRVRRRLVLDEVSPAIGIGDCFIASPLPMVSGPLC